MRLEAAVRRGQLKVQRGRLADLALEGEDAQRHRSLWQERWEVAEFPMVMVVYRRQAVLSGYRRAIADSRRALQTKFVAKSLADVLAGQRLDDWETIKA